MKDTEIIFLVEEDIEGGYTARALGFPIFTEGETIEEIKENVKDALRCHFEKVEDIPPLIRLHIVREELVNF
jgi:predicted RNase H-like HicB family nuclease